MLELKPVSLMVVYYRENEKVFCLMQERNHRVWEFPGGKIETAETPLDAALREMHEERGVSLKREEVRFFDLYLSPLESKMIIMHVFVIEAKISGDYFQLPLLPPTFDSNKKLIQDLILKL